LWEELAGADLLEELEETDLPVELAEALLLDGGVDLVSVSLAYLPSSADSINESSANTAGKGRVEAINRAQMPVRSVTDFDFFRMFPILAAVQLFSGSPEASILARLAGYQAKILLILPSVPTQAGLCRRKLR
jgi:hypothetical protein